MLSYLVVFYLGSVVSLFLMVISQSIMWGIFKWRMVFSCLTVAFLWPITAALQIYSRGKM